jgi:hypothetical protein
MLEQGSFHFEPSEPVTSPRRPLSPGVSIDLIMLKLLAISGSVDKVQAELTERGKTDPGMIDFLTDFSAWNGTKGETGCPG